MFIFFNLCVYSHTYYMYSIYCGLTLFNLYITYLYLTYINCIHPSNLTLGTLLHVKNGQFYYNGIIHKMPSIGNNSIEDSNTSTIVLGTMGTDSGIASNIGDNSGTETNYILNWQTHVIFILLQ